MTTSLGLGPLALIEVLREASFGVDLEFWFLVVGLGDLLWTAGLLAGLLTGDLLAYCVLIWVYVGDFDFCRVGVFMGEITGLDCYFGLRPLNISKAFFSNES